MDNINNEPDSIEWKFNEAESIEQWKEFLRRWPIDKIKNLELKDYTSYGTGKSFIYDLEFGIAGGLGGISGSTAIKFGIYAHNPNTDAKKEEKYSWSKRKYDSADEAFNDVKKKILQIIEASKSGNLQAIDDIEFAHNVKWKIAFLYQFGDTLPDNFGNFKIISVYKRESLATYIESKGTKPDSDKTSDYYKTIVEFDANNDKFSLWKLSKIVWHEYAKKYRDIAKLEQELLNKINSKVTNIQSTGVSTEIIEGNIAEISKIAEDYDNEISKLEYELKNKELKDKESKFKKAENDRIRLENDRIRLENEGKKTQDQIKNITTYVEHAKREEIYSFCFKIFAIIFTILLIIFNIFINYIYITNIQLFQDNLIYLIAKSVFINILPIFLISYLMKQSGTHRESQLIYRQRALSLSNYNELLNNIINNDNKDKLLLNISNILFADRLTLGKDKSEKGEKGEMLNFDKTIELYKLFKDINK